MRNIIAFLSLLLLTCAFSCKTPYQPKVISSTTNYLVVEGVINSNNSSTDSTYIKLSRTTRLSAGNTLVPELHAAVSVEDGQGYSVTLHEFGQGNYAAGPLGLDKTKKYRLRIKTSDSQVYLSDYATAVYTPPIDSIGFTISGYQAIIYVNTHNAANNTRYYRWGFDETWEFRAPYTSFFMSNGKKIVARPDADQYPTRCWQNDQSTDIVLGSTIKLVNDEIYQQPITYISGSSEKLSVRYSILVTQYGLSEDEFKFWSQVKKNTEQLGSIFDAQPSQINGNIHNTANPLEPVFGYIGITNVQTKRVYINHSSFPNSFYAPVLCKLDSIFYINPVDPPNPPNVATTLIPVPSAPLIPISPIVVLRDTVGFVSTSGGCLDCSLRGSKTAPPFWKEQ